jgi:hypothetical protein
MFLWCGCHCAPDSKSDPGPSEKGISLSGSILSYSSTDPAQPDPPDPPMPIIPCGFCAFGVSPQAYLMSWTYSGTAGTQFRPCCGAYGQPTYKLYGAIDIADPSVCYWRSNEIIPHAKRAPGQFGLSICEYPDKQAPRVVFRLGFPVANATFRIGFVDIRYRWERLGQPGSYYGQWVRYLALNEAGQTWRYYGPGSLLGDPPLNCLKTITFRREFQQPIWQGDGPIGDTFGGNSPCQQVAFSGWDLGLPETLTCTPVRV